MKNNICLGCLLIIILTMISGCASNSCLLDGICRTSSSHDTFEELFWETIRCFPANRDERQCAVYGTNEWVRVEVYPDGTPCRVVRGSVLPNGLPDNITTFESEYDFFGNILSSYSLYDYSKDQTEKINFEKSRYWRDSRRVMHVQSYLSPTYSYDVYYYQDSDSCLKVGVWALDRKRRSMDKLVLNVKLVDGCAIGEVNTDSHIGTLLNFQDISIDTDCRINLKFKLKIGETNIDVISTIAPVSKLTK